MSKREFFLEGLDCAEEVAALKRELAPLLGGEEGLAFDLLEKKLTVDLPAGVSLDQLQQAARRAGLVARPWSERQQSSPSSLWRRRGQTILCLASGLFVSAGFMIHAARHGVVEALVAGEGGRHPFPSWASISYLLATLCGAAFVLPRALAAARRLRPDMNLLMVLAALGAWGIGQYFEAASVAFLFSLALLLESWSVQRARRAISELLDLAPATARRRTPDGSWQEQAVGEISRGEILQVRAGERVPLDGVLISGVTAIDQSPITGESAPVEKGPGDQAFAGTINQGGVFELQVVKEAPDTTLAHLLRLAEQARSYRAKSQRWVDAFAAVYTPVMIALAAAVAIAPPLLSGDFFTPWFYRGLVLLVIACPCALVIATPVSIVAGLTAAARRGVLIKGGQYLELSGRIRAMALDKTGTVTAGQYRLQRLIPLDGHSEELLLARAAALEAHSEHPLARAVLQAAQQRGIAFAAATAYQSLPGRGASALIDGRKFWIGSHRLMHEMGHEPEAFHRAAEELESQGRAILALGDEQHVCGLISLTDEPRPQAAQVIEQLRRLGLQQLVLLSGDRRGTTAAVAAAVGLPDFRAELLPQDKVRQVQELKDRFGPTAMVGDGINDAPALAASDLGIAMGAAGSDAALEAADIALMADDLTRLPWLIAHSRRTRHTLRLNAFLAIGLKLIFLCLAVGGAATLWMAIAADMGVSLAVIANSLRLLHDRK